MSFFDVYAFMVFMFVRNIGAQSGEGSSSWPKSTQCSSRGSGTCSISPRNPIGTRSSGFGLSLDLPRGVAFTAFVDCPRAVGRPRVDLPLPFGGMMSSCGLDPRLITVFEQCLNFEAVEGPIFALTRPDRLL